MNANGPLHDRIAELEAELAECRTNPPTVHDADKIENLERINASVSERLDEMRRFRDEAVTIAADRRGRITALEQQNNGLLDTLNEMTIEKARLEGYIDRAREIEAPPVPTVLVPMPAEEVRHPIREVRPARRMMDYGSALEQRPAPWYRRTI